MPVGDVWLGAVHPLLGSVLQRPSGGHLPGAARHAQCRAVLHLWHRWQVSGGFRRWDAGGPDLYLFARSRRQRSVETARPQTEPLAVGRWAGAAALYGDAALQPDLPV